MITNDRLHLINGGARVHRDMFADNILRANLQNGIFTGIAGMLRRAAQACKREHLCSRTNHCVSGNIHVIM